MRKNLRTSLHNDQSGMAAFAITFILIVVISIITISFATIIRREQRAALDRNLSSRAFYAAESGINLASDKLRKTPAADLYYSATPKTSCGPDSPGTGYFTNADYTLDSGTSTQLSCLIIKTAVPQIIYQNVPQYSSQIVPLNAQSGSFTSLTFYWQNSAGVTNYGGCTAGGTNFPKLTSWGCNAGVIRVDLVRTSGGLSRSNMITGAFTVFFNPVSAASPGSVTVNGATTGANQGIVQNAHCQTGVTPYNCKGTIVLPGGWSSAYARIMPYYVDSSLAITAASGATPVNLTGAQAIVDSTGRAQDIVRRVQARIPIVPNSLPPDFALEGGREICKRYAIGPGTTLDYIDAGNALLPATFDTTTPCS